MLSVVKDVKVILLVSILCEVGWRLIEKSPEDHKVCLVGDECKSGGW